MEDFEIETFRSAVPDGIWAEDTSIIVLWTSS